MFTACAPHSQTSPRCFSLSVCLNQVSVSQEAHTIQHSCLTVTLKAVLKALTFLILEFEPGFYAIFRSCDCLSPLTPVLLILSIQAYSSASFLVLTGGLFPLQIRRLLLHLGICCAAGRLYAGVLLDPSGWAPGETHPQLVFPLHHAAGDQLV